MRNLIKFLCPVFIVFGVFVVLGTVSANEDISLQPAEGLGPTYVSVYATDLKVRGVSYLNGTVINDQSATETDPSRTRIGNFPVTIGDDLRVNGRIDRLGLGEEPVIIADNLQVDGNITNGSGPVKIGDDLRITGDIYNSEEGGSNPIGIADTIQPSGSVSYDLGNPDRRFRDAYLTGLDIKDTGSGATPLAVHVPTLSPLAEPRIALKVTYETESVETFYVYADGMLHSNSSGVFDGGLSVKGRVYDPDETLSLDNTINIDPSSGTPYVCDSSHRGDIIYNSGSADGQCQSQRFCGCAGSGWQSL